MEGVPDPVGSSNRAEESTSHSAADSPAASSPKKRKKKRGVNKNSDCNSQSSKASSPEVTPKRGQKRKKTSAGDSVNSPKVTAFGDGSGSVWSQLGAFKCKTCGFTTTEENFFNCHTCSSKRSIASSPSSSCSPISSRSAHTQNAVPPSIAPRPGSMVVPVALPSPSAFSSGSALTKTAVPSSAVLSPGLRVVLATASPHTAIDCSSALKDDAVPAVLDRRCSVPEEAASAVPRQGFIKHEMETGSFRCMQCNYRGKNKFFIEHLMYQMIINPYHCQHCSEKFADRSSFQKHCEQEHKGLKLECKLKRVSLVREVMNMAVKDGKEGKLTAFTFHPGFKACVKRSAKTGTPQPVPSSSQTVVTMPVTGFCSEPATTSTAAVSLASECAVNVTSSSAVSAPVLSAAVTTATSSALRLAADNATASLASVGVTASSATVSASTSPCPVAATAAASATVSASTAPPFVTTAPALTTLCVTASSATVSAPAISPFTAAAAALVTVGVTASSAAVNAPVSSPSVTAASALATGGVIASSATVSAPTVSAPVTALATVGVTAASAIVSASTSPRPVAATPVSSPPVTATAALVTVGVTASLPTVSAPVSSPPTAASLDTVGATSSSAVNAAESLSTVNVMMSSSAVCATVSPSAVSATTSAPVISTLLAPVSASRPSPPVGAASPVTGVSAAASSAVVGGATTVSAKTSTHVHATASSAAVSAASATVSVSTSSSAIGIIGASSSLTTVNAKTSAAASAAASSATVSAKTSSVPSAASATISAATTPATVGATTLSAASEMLPPSSTGTTIVPELGQNETAASDTPLCSLSGSTVMQTMTKNSSALAATNLDPAVTSHSQIINTSSSTTIQMEVFSESGSPLAKLAGETTLSQASESDKTAPAQNSDTVGNDHECLQADDDVASDNIVENCGEDLDVPVIIACQGNYIEHEGEEGAVSLSDEVSNRETVPFSSEQPTPVISSATVVSPVIVPGKTNAVSFVSLHACSASSVSTLIVPSQARPALVVTSQTKSLAAVTCQTGPDVVPVVPRQSCSVSTVPAPIVPSQMRPLALAAVTCQPGPNVAPVVPRQSGSVSFSTVHAPIVRSRTQSSQMGSSAAVSSLVGLNTVPVAHGSHPGSSLLSSCQFTSSATAPPLYMSVQTRQNFKSQLVQQRAVNANTQQNLFRQWRYRPPRSVDSSQNVQWVFQDVASCVSNPPPSYSTPTGSQVSTQFSYSSPAVNLQNQFVPLNLVNSDRIQNTYHGQLAQQLQQPSTPVPLPHGVILPSFISLPATSQVRPGTIMRYMVPGTVGVAQRQSSTVQNTTPAEGLQPALGPAHCVRKSSPQQELLERSVPQNVFPVYSPVSPASSSSPVRTAVSPVYTPISPVYTPISPVYTPISPASPVVHARVYSPISPPASTSVQRTASPGTTVFPLDLSSPDHAYAALTVPAQNPDQGSTHSRRTDFVSAGSASTLSSCSTTVSVAATISASSTAGTSMVKQEKTVSSCRKSVSGESLLVSGDSSPVSGDSFSVSAPATTTPPTSSTCNQADDSLCMGFIKRNNIYVCLHCRQKFLDSREFYLHVWKHQHSGGEKCSSCSSNPTPGTSKISCLKTTSVVENVSCNADARLLNYLRDDCREKLSRRLLHNDARSGPPVQSTDAEAGKPASCALESADALLTHGEDTSALLSEEHLQKEADESLLRKANEDPLREVDENPVKEAEEHQVRADGESLQEVSEDPKREAEEIEKDPLREDAGESVKTDEDRQREAEDSLRETEEDPQREAEEPTIGADSSNKRGKGKQCSLVNGNLVTY